MEKKINLASLKIMSFVTDLEDAKVETVKGGLPPSRPYEPVTDTWINCRTLECRNTRNCEYTN